MSQIMAPDRSPATLSDVTEILLLVNVSPDDEQLMASLDALRKAQVGIEDIIQTLRKRSNALRLKADGDRYRYVRL